MSHFSNSLDSSGPILNIMVGPSAPRRDAILNAGMQPSAPRLIRLLIDTGASATSIDLKILQSLELVPTGAASMLTPSTGGSPIAAPTYDVELMFTGIEGASHKFESMPVIGCDFSSQGIDGLFGRDALSKSRLIYSGPDSLYLLSF